MNRPRFPDRFRIIRRPPTRLGIAPGTISVAPDSAKPKIVVIAYGPDGFEEQTVEQLDEISLLQEKWPSVWIHIQGLGDEKMIAGLGERFALHKLALEDVVSRNQHPKIEPYENHLYIVALTVPDGGGLDFGQVNLFVSERVILTLQERKIAWDEPVRQRIREGRTRIRSLGANYLAFALLDSIVDRYFPLVEQYSDRLDTLEDEVLESPAQDEISRIHGARNEMLSIRRALTPLKDITRVLAREEIPPITDETRLFFRDCNDHVAGLIDTLEADREMARGLIDLCLSTLSHKMNEVMKVLTIIATIFIPLSFISGMYGMNFNTEKSPLNMPELNWYFGYPLVLGLMSLTVIGLLLYFRRKGWLGSAPRSSRREN